MTVDIRQFLQTFYEESFEGLDLMESHLLNVSLDSIDNEIIDSIFRAAHSIKGGSSTFGLSELASFTHLIETLLDRIRDGSRGLDQSIVDLLLKSIDCLREMLISQQAESPLNVQKIDTIKTELNGILQLDTLEYNISDTKPNREKEFRHFQIRFMPYLHMFHTGNDPLRFIRALANLGEAKVKTYYHGIPEFEKFDYANCYIGWLIDLRAETHEEDLREIFEWIEDDCFLQIVELGERAEKQQAETPNKVVSTNQSAKPSNSGETSSIRVGIDKVDSLINLVGELVITQSMLNQFGVEYEKEHFTKLQEGLAQLERNTRELQENVMRIRMLPISFAFNRFPRMVHDISKKLNKNIELKMSGENTELDKTVMEKIGDPLVHLVRNSLDHGFESEAERIAAGKPPVGTLSLNAYHQGGSIVIEIKDDGRGLDREKIRNKAVALDIITEDEELTEERMSEVLFMPGFSTASEVSDLSGRGVGMDVVKRNIRALGGAVSVHSVPGQGTIFSIRLPLTLAILDGQLIRVGEEIFIIPLVSIVESLQVDTGRVSILAGKAEVYRLRDEFIAINRLYECFNIHADCTELDEGLLVVVEGEGKQMGVMVDELLGQQQVVIKSLETNYKKIDGVSGATVLGDGTVALILDVSGLIRYVRESNPDINYDELKRMKDSGNQAA